MDFRPISLLITFSKIIEKIAAKQMKEYLINNNFLNKFQSAYKSKHSTITALVEITDHIFKSLDKSEITLLVLLDYSKAFDCANHKLILAKLKSFGFDNSALSWINSYLSSRSQQVTTEIGESSWITLLNGVPQGSILGPLLFTILISDIAKDIKFCKFHLYADDTQIFISGKVSELNLLIKKVNADLQKIANFSADNCLKLNELKSVFITLGSNSNISKINDMVLPDIVINNKPIKRETTVRNLGVLFDQNMSWESEINMLISNGYYKLRQAYSFKNFLSKSSKMLLVQSYILSGFNYSSIILQNLYKYQLDKLQKFQNACVRFILNLRKFDHISAGIKSLNLLKMDELRSIQNLTLLHKIVQGNAPAYLCEKINYQGAHHSHGTRSRFHIRLYNFRTNYGKNRFFNSICKEYNRIVRILSLTPMECSLYTLKNR